MGALMDPSSAGILLLDKPSGITSNNALGKVKRLLKIKKAGHTGSLDPLASGMLPICIGEATKFARFLLEADKCYHVVAKLGETTQTGDTEGEIVAVKDVPSLTVEEVESYLNPFRGQIDQVPSMYSALKYQGKPLYLYARKGIDIERPSRKINIYRLELDGIRQQNDQTTLSMVVECSKGTYIRTLVEDIGQAIGCGAHVIALRRLWVKGFSSAEMIKLNSLEASNNPSEFSLPIEQALTQYPEIVLSEEMSYYLQHGQAVRVGQKKTGWISLKNHQGEFIGMGEYLEDGRLAPRRMIQSIN